MSVNIVWDNTHEEENLKQTKSNNKVTDGLN